MSNHHKINYVEFPAKDMFLTKTFFSKVFDWKFQDYGSEYSSFLGAGIDGGFYKSELVAVAKKGGVLIVFYSENLEDSEQQVCDAGGEIVEPIFQFPGGRRFHFADPNGNEFAIWSDK